MRLVDNSNLKDGVVVHNAAPENHGLDVRGCGPRCTLQHYTNKPFDWQAVYLTIKLALCVSNIWP